jgi:hypothetical protein
MSLILEAGVEDRICGIAAKGNLAARREVAKVFAFLKQLEKAMTSGSPDFWNIAGSASGRLTAGKTQSNGESLWILYREHSYCIAVLSKSGGVIRVLAVCGGSELAQIEQRLCVP